MADKLGNWVFLNTSGRWEWRRLDPNGSADLARSAGVFSSLMECMNDARKHGYLPPGYNEPATPRRPSS
jgi:hypothetical protein